MSIIAIFILIGVAHWATHLVQCSSCHQTINDNLAFVLQGIICTFGWPIQLMTYIKSMISPMAPDQPRVEVIEMKQGKDESMEAFHARIANELNERAKKNKNVQP